VVVNTLHYRMESAAYYLSMNNTLVDIRSTEE